jgi:glucosamine-6-phosphate deaminase
MNPVILADDNAIGAHAAAVIVSAVADNPNTVLGLATGSSPLSSYTAVGALAGSTGVAFTRVKAFALDEYVGLPPESPQSYHSVIRHTAVDAMGLDPRLVRVPAGFGVADLDEECTDFERAIAAAGGVDIQILGLGSNGHIGFNEPGSSFQSRTRVQELADSTRSDNASYFANPSDVPRFSVTQGLGTIMAARSIILIAVGARKAAALAAASSGPVTELCPASILQRHPNVTVLADHAAAAVLMDSLAR